MARRSFSAETGSPLITAFFHNGGRGTGRANQRRVVAMRGTAAGFASVLAHTTSQAPGAGSDVSRIALVAIAVAAVAAFTVLQVIARSRCGRDGGPPDWPS